MSIQERFYRAFTRIRARLKQSHPQVKDITYEIPSAPGSTLRVQVGVVMANDGRETGRMTVWEVEQVIQECLNDEGLPAATELHYATPEALGGETAYRHFFAKAGKV